VSFELCSTNFLEVSSEVTILFVFIVVLFCLLIFAERPSPSSPQEQAEPRLEAGEGLDVTACSASSLLARRRKWFDIHTPKLADGEITSKQYCDMFIEAGLCDRLLTMEDYYANKEWADAMIAETNLKLACQSQH
jgi:hypothetical protein